MAVGTEVGVVHERSENQFEAFDQFESVVPHQMAGVKFTVYVFAFMIDPASIPWIVMVCVPYAGGRISEPWLAQETVVGVPAS